jgi:hypothetical protein
MLGPEQIERYRRMSPAERLKETEELMTLAWRMLLELPAEERERRLRIIREAHEEEHALILDYLRRRG